MKLLIKKILKENIDDKIFDFVLTNIERGIIKPPYVKTLSEDFDLPNDQIKTILKKIIGGKVTMYKNGDILIIDRRENRLYEEHKDGWWTKQLFDERDNLIYSETHDGWAKWEYDGSRNLTYYENDEGTWAKYEYEKWSSKIIYQETSDEGVVKDLR